MIETLSSACSSISEAGPACHPEERGRRPACHPEGAKRLKDRCPSEAVTKLKVRTQKPWYEAILRSRQDDTANSLVPNFYE
jgi:hypothetical protein